MAIIRDNESCFTEAMKTPAKNWKRPGPHGIVPLTRTKSERLDEIVPIGTFLDLPCEIRRLIYDCLVGDTKRHFSPRYGEVTQAQRDIATMISTCKTIRTELTTMFFSSCVCVAYPIATLPSILWTCGALACSHMRAVEFTVSYAGDINLLICFFQTRYFPNVTTLCFDTLSRSAFFDAVAILSFQSQFAQRYPVVAISWLGRGNDSELPRLRLAETKYHIKRSHDRVCNGDLPANFTLPVWLQALTITRLDDGEMSSFVLEEIRETGWSHGRWEHCRESGQLGTKDGSACERRLVWKNRSTTVS